jgi:hypothetical protein
MYEVFANPEPLLLIGYRLMTYRADPVHDDYSTGLGGYRISTGLGGYRIAKGRSLWY